jgi:hypothetical protein
MSASLVGIAVVAGAALGGWAAFRHSWVHHNTLSSLRDNAIFGSILALIAILRSVQLLGPFDESLSDLVRANVADETAQLHVYLTYFLCAAVASIWVAYLLASFQANRRQPN